MKKAPNSSLPNLPVAVSDFYTFHMGFTLTVRCVKDDIIIWADTPELLEKKNNWSSASNQIIRNKTESTQVSIHPASIEIPQTHNIQQGNSTKCQKNKSYHRRTWTNQPTNQPTNQSTNQPTNRNYNVPRHDYIPGKSSPKLSNQNSTSTSSGEGYYLVFWQASKGDTSRP